MRKPVGFAALISVCVCAAGVAGEPPRKPAVADGWAVELAGRMPEGFAPSSLTVGPDGRVLVGGRSSGTPAESGSILALTDAGIVPFAAGLNPVAGLERIGDSILVFHPPLLSAIRDADGDGRAEARRDLGGGLGGPSAGLASGAMRRGMDGFLYLAIEEGGLSEAPGRGGGVLRVRPDGKDFEILSTGDARPASPAISAHDDLFTFSTADDSRWGLRLIQHVAGGRYGYPRHFVAAEFRALPAVAKLEGRSAGQAVVYDEDRLPDEYRGNLVACEPEVQAVFRHELRKAGGGFTLARRTPLATRGALADFHPRGIAAAGDGFWIVDEADGAGGRLYRLSYVGDGLKPAAARPADDSVATWVGALDHPSRSIRLDSQDRLVASGPAAVSPLIARLGVGDPATGRLHAMWALDAIGGDAAREAIRVRLDDGHSQVRLQAARSAGIRKDRPAVEPLTRLLTDRDPAVRREAAIALGRIGERSTAPALLASLGDADRFAAWSIRRALLDIGCDDREALAAALVDPSRREAALLLADESWSVPLVEALVAALPKTPEPVVRGRILSCLAAQYRRYPEGAGPAGKTEPWDPAGMAAVLRGLEIGLKDADASVRYQAVYGLQSVGAPAAPLLRAALPGETDVDAQAALVEALGALNDATSTRLLLPIVVDPKRPEPVRSAALDSLNKLRGRDVVRARLNVLYEENAPEALVAKALPALARDGFLPPNDLAGFLHHASPLVRAAAVVSLNPSRPLPLDVKEVVLARLDDEDADVRRSAYLAAGPLQLREAVPRLLEKTDLVQDGDRAAVLTALCAIPDPRALPVYASALEDPDPSLRRGAVRALLAIRDRVEPELRRLAAEDGRSDGAKLSLERVLARLEPVRGWSVLGPLGARPPALMTREGAVDASRSYPGAGGTAVRWARAAEADDGVVDLGALSGASQTPSGVTAAAFAEFASVEARRAILVVEADGPIEVFLNGSPVEAAGSDDREAKDSFAVPVVKGPNRVVAIGRPGAASWRFAISLSAPSDAPAR